MARSDQVKALLRSHREGDEQRFRSTAQSIIEDAKRRRHDSLAAELEAILDEPVRTRKPSQLSSLRALPTGRDDAPLLTVRQPKRLLGDLVFPPETYEVLVDLLEEHRLVPALHAHGLEPRRSLLFAGPSGTGKSAAAEALAGELGWPIAQVQLATVVSSYLGETAKNLDQIFSFIQSGSWVLLFDEFDTLARDRSERGDHGELRRVVTALLQLIESSVSDSIIVATSNHAGLLDGALWRRFDEIIGFDLPTPEARGEVLRMKLRNVKCSISPDSVARELHGYSHADVETVALDAMRIMIRESATVLGRAHVAYAVDRMEARRRAIKASLGSAPSALPFDSSD